jgi:dUTP pyrophosphatase
MKIKLLQENAKIPTKGSPLAAGYDLYSTEEYTLMPMERKLFKTGISLSIPTNMYGRIAPRSGLAYKDGIDVLAGVIDPDYTGDIGVILINFGTSEKKITFGDKIAQIIFENYNNVSFDTVSELSSTERGSGGYGSTDIPKPKKTESALADLYEKSGGIPVKDRYIDEMKSKVG